MPQRIGRLGGKVAVVTGAASGIGLATARAYLAEGATVGLLDIPSGPVQDVAHELGRSAFGLTCDVADEASVTNSFDRVRQRGQRLDVLVNCAAVQLNGRDARAHELDLAAWQDTIAVNLTGAYLCCKYAIPLMIEGGGGSIINCGSPTGVRGSGSRFTAYTASKGGVMALTRVLAIDYAADAIRVNTLVPGTTDTPLIQTNIADNATRRVLESNIPLGRLAQPSDYAGIAVYLASDESRYATGAEFVIDGGITAR